MIIALIVMYLLIAFCTWIGFLYYEYRQHAVGPIDFYVECHSDDIRMYFIVGILWPISLIMVCVMNVMPALLIRILIFVDHFSIKRQNNRKGKG